MKAAPLSFTSWLQTQRRRNDPIGDFALDWCEDRDRPKGRYGYRDVRSHLVDSNAVREARYAGALAWREWRRNMARGRGTDAKASATSGNC